MEFVGQNQSVDLVYSCNALDHTQDLPAAMIRIRDVLRARGIALVSVYIREGTRNNFAGLHKYDIWLDRKDLMYSSRETSAMPLLQRCPGLRLGRVAHADEKALVFILIRD